MVLLTGACRSSAEDKTTVDPAIHVTTINEQSMPTEQPHGVPIVETGDRRNMISGYAATIVENASGTARVPADSAVLHTVFSARSLSGPMRAITDDDALPILKALQDAGVDRGRITLKLVPEDYPDPRTTVRGNVDISLPVNPPSAARAEELADVIGRAERYPLYHAFSDVTYGVRDCSAVSDSARRDAFKNARDAIAQSLSGRDLGRLISITDENARIGGRCGSDQSQPAEHQLAGRVGKDPDAGYVTSYDTLTVEYALP